MTSISLKKKIIFISITLIMGFIALEIVLRLSGVALRLGVDYKELKKRNKITDKNVHRVMVLGESTSDNYWQDEEDGAWPNQLEKLLNKNNIPTKVINLAKGGNTTALMMSNLLDNLDSYKPDIVVSMMGINDWGETSFVGKVSEANLFFNNLRIGKLFRWIYFRFWAAQFEEVLTRFPLDYLEKEEEYFQLFQSDPENPQEILKQIYIFPGSKCDKAVYLTRVVERYFHLETKRTPIQYYLIQEALNICPQHDIVMFWFFHSYTYNEAQRATCRSQFPKLKKYLLNIPDRTFANLLNCYLEGPIPEELQKVLDYRKLSIARKDNNITAKHYRYLADVLKERGIKLVAMQYPTLEVEKLKGYFKDTEDIYFVENKNNFAPYMNEERKFEVFLDFFARTWGHTTVKGHRLIAENLYPVVAKILKEKSDSN